MLVGNDCVSWSNNVVLVDQCVMYASECCMSIERGSNDDMQTSVDARGSLRCQPEKRLNEWICGKRESIMRRNLPGLMRKHLEMR